MSLTEEQLSAQRALQEAVEKHVAAFRPGMQSTGEVLTDWALVGCLVSYDDEGQRCAYHVAYLNGELPEHVATGLFTIGKAIATGQYVEESDED